VHVRGMEFDSRGAKSNSEEIKTRVSEARTKVDVEEERLSAQPSPRLRGRLPGPPWLRRATARLLTACQTRNQKEKKDSQSAHTHNLA